jgi:glucose/arabinose dehydrogenase
VAPVKESVPFEQAGAESWPVQVTTLVDNLDDPWGMDFLPDGRLLVTEQSGRLQLISPDSFQATPVANVPATIEAGQGGLMDVLVHPEFATNQWVYLSYTVESDGKYSTRVSRARLRDATLHDLEPLFTAQPFYKQKRHFGSRLVLADG